MSSCDFNTLWPSFGALGLALELLAVAESFNLSKVFLYVSMGGQEKGELSGGACSLGSTSNERGKMSLLGSCFC